VNHIYLSNIELYYAAPKFIKKDIITLVDEEYKHAVKVMRNSIGNSLHITDGVGNIFVTRIKSIKKNYLEVQIEKKYSYDNSAANIWFCIPLLKNPDRMKFAIEKSVELGIKNFIVFVSNRSVPKKINLARYKKIALAAMKQSLRTYLPIMEEQKLGEIISSPGKKVLFDQCAEKSFQYSFNLSDDTYFVFGPEGGYDESELVLFQSSEKYKLSNNRLRSETAIVKCASLLQLT
jgi:16S rRNA (uracil1498-N3)-methyltransferase